MAIVNLKWNCCKTDDEKKIRKIIDKASLLCFVRMIRKLRKKGTPSETDREKINAYLEKIAGLAGKLDRLEF